LIRIGRYHWLTAGAWNGLSINERIHALKGWCAQSGVSAFKFTSLPMSRLPREIRVELKRLKYSELLNTYASVSGPNCFAAAAGAVAQQKALSQLWLHWKPLAAFLQRHGYERTKHKQPQPTDVLVFSNTKEVRHASYYLGAGLFFEKPSQDFYSPYRIAYFRDWKRENRGQTLTIWRREN
jgi:hypothetical protein